MNVAQPGSRRRREGGEEVSSDRAPAALADQELVKLGAWWRTRRGGLVGPPARWRAGEAGGPAHLAWRRSAISCTAWPVAARFAACWSMASTGDMRAAITRIAAA